MPSKRRLLESLVTLHDRDDRPVPVDRLAGHLDADPVDISAQLDRLRSCELVTRAADGSGYVPTITAHELLALDVDDDQFLVIEVPDDEPDDSSDHPGTADR